MDNAMQYVQLFNYILSPCLTGKYELHAWTKDNVITEIMVSFNVMTNDARLFL
jgi:hypothetical protein